MFSVNLRENIEKTLAIKEFKRDYSLMAKFFFYSRSWRLQDWSITTVWKVSIN